MKKNMVSIITPCLNSEKTIRQTVESVLQQTYEDIEYIIIDGKSSDRTLEIICEYVSSFQGRMQYISEQDNGIYDAMNKGIAQATGDIIGIINSDDWYERDAVEEIVKCFMNTDAEVVYGEEWILNENRQREYHTYHMGFPPHPGMFVRREAYQKYGMYDLKYQIASDWDLILRFMAGGVPFERIDRIVANYSKSGVSSVRSLACAKETYEIELKYLGKCNENILNRNDIEEKYNRVQLLYISQKEPETVRRTLKQKYDMSDGIVIFGAGACGKELESILRNCGIAVPFFVDNDERKWGLAFNGIKILSPEILRYHRGHVLITTTRFQKDICTQLQGYSNPALSWSGLDAVRKRVISDCENLFVNSKD